MRIRCASGSDNPWLRLLVGWSPERARKLRRWPFWLSVGFAALSVLASAAALFSGLPGDFLALAILGYPAAGLAGAPALGTAVRRGLVRHPLAPDLLGAMFALQEPAQALRARIGQWTLASDAAAAAGMAPAICGTAYLWSGGSPDTDTAIVATAAWCAMLANWAAGFRWRAALFAAGARSGVVSRTLRAFKLACASCFLGFARLFGAAFAMALVFLLLFGESYVDDQLNNKPRPTYISPFEIAYLALFGAFELLCARKRLRKASDAWTAAAFPLAEELRAQAAASRG